MEQLSRRKLQIINHNKIVEYLTKSGIKFHLSPKKTGGGVYSIYIYHEDVYIRISDHFLPTSEGKRNFNSRILRFKRVLKDFQIQAELDKMKNLIKKEQLKEIVV